MKYLIYICFVFLFLGKIKAQDPQINLPPQDETPREEQLDTTKLRISVKSLRSDMMSFDTVPFDTSLEDIHLQHQLLKKYIFISHLGNLGLAAKPNNYFQQASSNDFFFADAIRYNFIHKDDILYYKTNHPYSNISYNTSAKTSVDLQSIQFIHTQNVNRKLNVGTLLKLHGSNGFYPNQKSTTNAISLFSGYDGDYYNFNAVASYNTLKNQENGGLISDTLFEQDKDKGSVYPTVFQNANTNIRNTYFFISQRFNLAGMRKIFDKNKNDSVRRFSGIGLLHTLEYNHNTRKYSDPVGPSISASRFYSLYHNVNDSTNDSLLFSRLENSVELLLGKQNPNEPPILIRGGIRSVYDKYKYHDRPDTVLISDEFGDISDTSYVRKMYSNHYNNLALTGGITLGIKSIFLLTANADYFFAGYKAGDLYLHGSLINRLSKKPGSLSYNILMDLSRYKPGYFYDRYFSNHFEWNNGFIPVKEVRTGIEITWPAINLGADFNHLLLSSPVYFDSSAFPRQYDGEVSILESSVFKGFKAGIFHTKFKAMLQITSNDRVVPLPLFSGYNSSYIELKLFKKVMTTQLGFDARYNTAYYANGYMPDLGVFYNQHQKKIGNYPYVDAFLNVKVKRLRFYLRFEHVNSDLLSRTYYTVLHYPVNSRMLLYGLSWNFYD